MSRTLLATVAGTLELPSRNLILADAADGGHLVVNPPRPVWERSELEADELARWSLLVAAAGRAMLDTLPALDGGCINYWEAGNWSLHVDAPPAGPKDPRVARRVHLHLLGRSPRAASAAMRWGEAPCFPDFADRYSWAAGHRRLSAAECAAVVGRTVELLRARYGFAPTAIEPSVACSRCAIPMPTSAGVGAPICSECAA